MHIRKVKVTVLSMPRRRQGKSFCTGRSRHAMPNPRLNGGVETANELKILAMKKIFAFDANQASSITIIALAEFQKVLGLKQVFRSMFSMFDHYRL
jgi:hypothetical protein